MNTARTALTGLVIAALLAAACGQAETPAPTPAADARSATVGDLAGQVSGRPSAGAPLAAVAVGFQLRAGGEVQTGEASRARLDFSDGTILRLAADSAFVLQSAAPAADGGFLGRVQLNIGKLWVSLTGGELEVETPVGVAAVRGSYAVFTYQPGNPDEPDDDLLVIDCLEGSCRGSNDVVDEQLGNLERLVLGRQASLRQTLTEDDVRQFLAENPESAALVATLTAAPPATATPPGIASPTGASPLTATPTGAAPTDTVTPTATETATATLVPVTAPPNVPIAGVHTVQIGETLFCLGRAYGVLPAAIAAVNNLGPSAPLSLGQRLNIPAVRWTTITPGPVCAAQFPPPFPGLPTLTPSAPATATPTLSPTPVCAPGEFFDPTLQQCRSLTPPPTNTLPPTATPTLVPTATPDSFGPSITNLQPNSAVSVGSRGPGGCNVTFSADISDPSGVASARVDWTATNMIQLPVPGSVPLVPPRAGTTWSVTWPVSTSLASFYDATITWSLTASDSLGNSATAAGPGAITVLANLGGCP